MLVQNNELSPGDVTRFGTVYSNSVIIDYEGNEIDRWVSTDQGYYRLSPNGLTDVTAHDVEVALLIKSTIPYLQDYANRRYSGD